MRGVDKEGNVANAVETEQIIIHNGVATSLVQTRGSIPLFWKQTPSLKYKPRLNIYGSEIETVSLIYIYMCIHITHKMLTVI